MFNSFSNIEFQRAGKCRFLIVLALFLLTSCNVGNKSKLGIVDAQLTPCPSSPNCVSSDTISAEQKVMPFELTMPPTKAWDLLVEHVSQLPRTELVRQEPRYLYVECRSQFFGFVDDLEFHMRPEKKLVAIRSASRTGYYDFGVNRARIEKLRITLQEAGAVR